MIQYFPIVTGSLTVLGNINVSGSITTSGSITISGSITSASFADSASNATNAISASYANNLTVAGTLTAQTLVVQTVTSSVIYSSGSNVFGNSLGNTQTFTGSVLVTGSITATEGNFLGSGVDGSLGSVVRISTTNTNGNARNWALVNTFDSYGDLNFRLSTAQGGNALTAGTTVLTLSRTGAATFSGSVNVNGLATSANYKLGVTGAAFISGTNNKGVFITDGASYASIVGLNSAIAAYNPIELRASGTDYQLYLTTGGYVGVNTINPGGRFQVNGGGSSEISFQLNDGSTRRSFFIPSQYYGYMWALGIVANGGKGWSFGNQDGTEVGTIVINAGGVAFNTTSDYRLKEDLKDFNGLDKVSAIKVYDFKWKNLDERTNGVLAHELAEVLPYAVSGVKDALNHEGKIEAQSVDYSKLTPVLVKAIQELNTKFEEYKATHP
jgi:hypothetical protein